MLTILSSSLLLINPPPPPGNTKHLRFPTEKIHILRGKIPTILSLAGGYFHLMFAIKDNTSNLWTQTVTSVQILTGGVCSVYFLLLLRRSCIMQIDLLQTRGLKLLYWSFIFFIFHSEIASEILSEESMGKPISLFLFKRNV